MGSWASFYINDREVDSWKGSIGDAYELFTEADLHTAKCSYHYVLHNEELAELEEDEILEGHYYRSTAKAIGDRLDLLGYTLEAASAKFNEGVEIAVERCKDYAGGHSTPKSADDKPRPSPNPFNPDALNFLKNYTFERWYALLKAVFDKGIKCGAENNSVDPETAPHLYYILNCHEDYFGFPEFGNIYVYRVMLTLVPAEAPVVLDISEMYGYSSEENYTCNPPRTILLTEGHSDSTILATTLNLLWPHLAGYFLFVDYNAVDLPGSAGHLLNGVRLLAATGIERRTIAIFDNDSAGHDALRQLATVTLPERMRALELPPLDIAVDYPTIGPQGQMNSDINSRACSIELYLGRDILEDENGDLTPVQWGNWIAGVRAHQGVIMNKARLQDDYLRLLASLQNPEDAPEHDWSGMRLVFGAIFGLLQTMPVYDIYEVEDRE